MSRANDQLRKFFPQAPSVLQERNSVSASDRKPSDTRRATQSSSSSISLSTSSKSQLKQRVDEHKSSSDHRSTVHEDDEAQRVSPGDLLNTVGSASSLSSAASSVFSSNLAVNSYNGTGLSMHALTPLTNADSSPPGKPLSPRTAKRSYEQMQNGTTTSPYLAPTSDERGISETITPVQTPPEPNLQARPGPGAVKGSRLIYDPENDQNLTSKERKKYKPRYKEFGAENEPSAPPDPRLAIAGYSTGAYHRRPSKAKLRLEPYVVKKYSHDPKTSIGPGLPTRVVVTGFNPLSQESKIRSLLGSYGEIVEFTNKTDPITGIFLGVCSVTYKDKSPSKRGEVGIKATEAARRAEKEGSGHRIDQLAVKIETDREGIKCRKYVEKVLKVKREEQAKQNRDDPFHRRPPPPPTTPIAVEAPPPNAPKGPSGRGAAMLPPPAGPRVLVPPRPAAHSLVELAPVLPSLKRKPYLFLSHVHVPVLGTTIAHLRKRLKSYDFKDVRCDKTGYYIVFDDSRRGEDEAARCYAECNQFPLFTYTMSFELQQYGNPNYERSPSPERVAAVNREKEERMRIKREDQQDWEAEKKQRAENLDPVRAALELLGPELKDVILKELKAKIAVPAIFDALDPDRHVEKRKKLNIPDPREVTTQRPLLPLPGQLSPFTGGLHSRGKAIINRKPFSKEKQRSRREELRQPVNVYDERRKRPVPSRARPIVPLHRRLQDFHEDEESDDERHTAITRGSEDPESHPQSEVGASPAHLGVDSDGLQTPNAKRRRTETWAPDSEDEGLEHLSSKGTLAHLSGKEPEDMAMRELEQVIAVLPHASQLRKRALAEVRLRVKAKQDDKLFGIVTADVEAASAVDDADMADATPEPADTLAKKKKAVVRPKKKTKKQLLEEQELAKAEAKAEAEIIKTLEEEEAPTPVVVEPEQEEPRAEVEWSVSREKPRRTVEDDPDVVLDIDGWQHLLKDEEDISFLRDILQSRKPALLGDINLWSWNQKEIKALNLNGKHGVVKNAARIEGYYVPNSTGGARTEGIMKISQVEKSKYLPHRIRVQKAREERERQAKDDPTATVEAAKLSAAAKMASTAISRSNRVNNRRLVNDINIQKQTLGADTDALKFNQLKKRKKLVRFDRSAIHNWGLYAEENIAANDMIIEYVGEKVRQRVADLREINYQKQGIGSSYLFRIDEDTVVDATKKGGIARFINHSCSPCCTAKIIKVDGTKRIVIYALRDIGKNEELTYDYKFEREINSDDRIPCLCGSVACKGFLN